MCHLGVGGFARRRRLACRGITVGGAFGVSRSTATTWPRSSRRKSVVAWPSIRSQRCDWPPWLGTSRPATRSPLLKVTATGESSSGGTACDVADPLRPQIDWMRSVSQRTKAAIGEASGCRAGRRLGSPRTVNATTRMQPPCQAKKRVGRHCAAVRSCRTSVK